MPPEAIVSNESQPHKTLAAEVAKEKDRIPSVIYIKPTTLLCRWDNGDCKSNEDKNVSGLPNLPPSRRVSLERLEQADAECRASEESGVDLGAINLVPVHFLPTTHVQGTTTSTDDSLNAAAAQTKPVPMAECSQALSEVLRLDPAAIETPTSSPSAAAVNSSTPQATVVFCIRRAGCGSCRDHGLELARLSRELDFSFRLVGIIKETACSSAAGNTNDCHDHALAEFYKDYFPFPIYLDEECQTFSFLGNRKLSVWKLLQGHIQLASRYRQKQIKNIPFGGDLFTQGGILVFDKHQCLRYVYYEQYGDELDVPAIRWAIESASMNPSNDNDVIPSSASNSRNGNLDDSFSSTGTDTEFRKPKRLDSSYENMTANLEASFNSIGTDAAVRQPKRSSSIVPGP